MKIMLILKYQEYYSRIRIVYPLYLYTKTGKLLVYKQKEIRSKTIESGEKNRAFTS